MKRILAAVLVVGGLTAAVRAGSRQSRSRCDDAERRPRGQARVHAGGSAGRIEGRVLMGAVVLTDGAVDNVVVERSLDSSLVSMSRPSRR